MAGPDLLGVVFQIVAWRPGHMTADGAHAVSTGTSAAF